MHIEEYLQSCPALEQLCGRDGKMDHDSLEVIIERHDDQDVIARVEFDEVVPNGPGGAAGLESRVRRWARLRVHLGSDGDVERVEKI